MTIAIRREASTYQLRTIFSSPDRADTDSINDGFSTLTGIRSDWSPPPFSGSRHSSMLPIRTRYTVLLATIPLDVVDAGGATAIRTALVDRLLITISS